MRRIVSPTSPGRIFGSPAGRTHARPFGRQRTAPTLTPSPRESSVSFNTFLTEFTPFLIIRTATRDEYFGDEKKGTFVCGANMKTTEVIQIIFFLGSLIAL